MMPRPHPRFSRKSRRDHRRRERASPFLCVIAGLGLGTIGGLAWVSAPQALAASGASSPFTCHVDRIADGDTFRCVENDANGRQIRVRLSGVAARETDGTCSDGHPCPTASAEAATAELRRLAGGQRLTCQDVGETYGRVAAFCRRSDGVDLSCAMVESGTALRWDRYWGSHRC